MATRFDADFKNLVGAEEVTWRAELKDDLGTPVGQFECVGGQGILIQQQGSTDAPRAGIFPTECLINFLVENAQSEFYIDDLIEHERSRFSMIVRRNGVFHWAGRFTTQDISFADQSYPTPSEIVAQDGLGLLKHKDFKNTDTGFKLSGVTDFWTIIKTCFDQMDVQDLYEGDTFLQVTNDWVSNVWTTLTKNPFLLAGVSQNIFNDPDADLNDFTDCWDVLKAIMVAWDCVLTHGDGRFHIYQLRSIANPPYRVFYYDTTLTQTGQNTAYTKSKSISTDYSNLTAPHGGGNIWTVVEGLQEVDTILEIRNNVLADDLTWGVGDDGYKSVGVLQTPDDPDPGQGLHIQLSGKLFTNTTLEFTPSSVGDILIHRYFFIIELRFTDQLGVVAQRKMSLRYEGFPGTPGDTYDWWNPVHYTAKMILTDNADINRIDEASEVWMFEEVDVGQFEPANAPVRIFNHESFEISPDGTTFDVDMKVSLRGIWEVNTETDISANPNYSFDWSCYDVKIIAVDGSTTTGERKIRTHHIATNPDTYEVSEDETILFGDAANQQNGIMVRSDEGQDWKYSKKEWRFRDQPLFANHAFPMLRSRSVLALRLRNKRMYEGQIIDTEAAFDKTIAYQGRNYFPTGRMQHMTSLDIIQGSWFELFEDDLTDVTETEEDVLGYPPFSQTPADPPWDLPPGHTPADPPGLVTDAGIDSGVAITSVDILNPTGLSIDAGEWVQILNMSTLETLTVQLTADITPASTSMSFESVTPTSDFQSGMPISLLTAGKFKTLFEIFSIGAADATNNYIEVTTALWSTTAINAAQYNTKVKVYRGAGTKRCIYSASPTDGKQFGVTTDGGGDLKRITFPASPFGLFQGDEVWVEYEVPDF